MGATDSVGRGKRGKRNRQRERTRWRKGKNKPLRNGGRREQQKGFPPIVSQSLAFKTEIAHQGTGAERLAEGKKKNAR